MSASRAKSRPRRLRAPKPTFGFWALLAAILLFAAYAGLIEASRPHVSGDPLRYDAFIDLAERDRIVDARILDHDGIVQGTYIRRDGTRREYQTTYFKSEVLRERVTDVLIPNGIRTTVDQQLAKSFIGPLMVLIPVLIIALAIVYSLLAYRRGTGPFAIRSGARKASSEDPLVSFDDVAAQDRAVTELQELSTFLSDPGRFAAMGVQVPKGVLLYGPPGCGKTLAARALAGEAGASFLSISGSDFVEMYVGVGAARVRDLFKEARDNAPAIVFIDELDSVGRRRSAGSGVATGSGEEQEQALNQILAEMDGFSAMEGIIVVGATNRPDVLDPALLRPGRFDRTIALDRPDEKGRLEILSVHARPKPLDRSVDLAAIARRAVGMTGADLANILNEAGLLSARGGRSSISQADLEAATQQLLEAPERQRRLSMRERDIGQRALREERVTFADVAGVEEAIEELSEVREFLDSPERFTNIGARFPRGFLLIGPPGCGKTLLARAVANEANAAFISVAATEFTEAVVGEGAARVRDLFAQARAVQPATVFIDELDAIGAARESGGVDGHREREQTLNQILIELDGFRPRDGVIVMAASNRPEILDPALVRPGRFDRTIVLGLPDREGRRAILDVHANGKRLAADVDLDAAASVTRGMSGADLANVMNEAALLAARRRLKEIPMSLVDEAIERVELGLSRGHVLSEEERRRVAYHEAGHGLVAAELGGTVPHKLTIVPRGQDVGAMWQVDEERVIHSRPAMIDLMATLLAGRAAEEMVLGEPGSGAADDLARVGRIARQMVRELGMSDALGALTYGDGNGGAPYSQETAQLIDAETRRLVAEAEGRAEQILQRSAPALHRVANALLERETLTSKEFEQLVRSAGTRQPERATRLA